MSNQTQLLEDGDFLQLFHNSRDLGRFEVVATFFGESACVKRVSDSFQLYIPCKWALCKDGFCAEEFTISVIERNLGGIK